MSAPTSNQPGALENQTIGHFLQSLGDKTPTPGGGAVASIIAALGADLGRMVVNYSLGEKKFADSAELHEEAVTRLQELANRAVELAKADEIAYGHLNDLMKLPKDDPKRIAQWDAAVEQAIDTPRQVLGLCMGLAYLLERLNGTTSRMLDSDLVIAVILAEAGVHAAAWNIRINLPMVQSKARNLELRSEIERTLARAERIRQQIEKDCQLQA